MEVCSNTENHFFTVNFISAVWGLWWLKNKRYIRSDDTFVTTKQCYKYYENEEKANIASLSLNPASILGPYAGLPTLEPSSIYNENLINFFLKNKFLTCMPSTFNHLLELLSYTTTLINGIHITLTFTTTLTASHPTLVAFKGRLRAVLSLSHSIKKCCMVLIIQMQSWLL